MDASTSITYQPITIPRAEHSISRANISSNALKVLYRLHNAGYRACLVGGGVRDLLLQSQPKDFDVCTDAHPEEIRQLFRNARLIGRRFRLAHIRYDREIIEVATFRGQQSLEDDEESAKVEHAETGLILRDNVYGTIEEDALRRDFTVNALYYDIDGFSVLDYAGGMQDLEAGVLRLIGDPDQRYREDPVRMLRAVRFAAKLGFRLHPETEAPIHRLAPLLKAIPSARLFDELLKLLLSGHAVQTLELLRLYGLFEYLLPLTERCLREHKQGMPRALLNCALANTDERIALGKPVTPAFLYAALLWFPMRQKMQPLIAAGVSASEALQEAADSVVMEQNEYTSIPRRFSGPMREIWALQSRFEHRSGKRPMRFLEHPRFRAAYDFLLLRVEAGEQDLAESAEWWTRFQTLSEEDREQNQQSERRSGKRRRGRRRRH